MKKMTSCLAGLCSWPSLTIFSRKFEILRLARQKSPSAWLACAHHLRSQSFPGNLKFLRLARQKSLSAWLACAHHLCSQSLRGNLTLSRLDGYQSRTPIKPPLGPPCRYPTSRMRGDFITACSVNPHRFTFTSVLFQGNQLTSSISLVLTSIICKLTFKALLRDTKCKVIWSI